MFTSLGPKVVAHRLDVVLADIVDLLGRCHLPVHLEDKVQLGGLGRSAAPEIETNVIHVFLDDESCQVLGHYVGYVVLTRNLGKRNICLSALLLKQ